MTEDVLFLCQTRGMDVRADESDGVEDWSGAAGSPALRDGGAPDPRPAGGGVVSEGNERGATVIELLLREPEVVAWLEPAADDDEDDGFEPPHAA
jgi:hypothetical protein